MTAVLLILLVVVGLIVFLAMKNAKSFSDANEILPGIDTGAPHAWAGAHSHEARLHRRLRDAMTALAANAALDDPSMDSIRTTLQDEAVAVDRRLVAVAALAPRLRNEPMSQVEAAVDAVETAVAEVVSLRGPSAGDVSAAIDDVRTRLRLVEDARRELEAFAPGHGLDDAMETLRAGLADGDDRPADDVAVEDTTVEDRVGGDPAPGGPAPDAAPEDDPNPDAGQGT